MNSFYPYSYIRGKVVPTKEAHIPIQCKVVQYGLGVFSSVRGYWSEKEEQVYLFHIKANYQRLKQGCKTLMMEWKMSEEEFKEVLIKLVKKNKCKESLYIRPIIYDSATTLVPRLKNDAEDFAAYMMPLGEYIETGSGLKTCISSWKRFRDDMIPTKAKATGGYVNSSLAKTEALIHGYDEAIFLNSKGYVAEGSAENLFGIKDGILYTPPLSADILAGITRKTVITIAQEELKLEVREENIDRSTLYGFDEVFLTGTAAKVAWVQSVDGRIIGKGKIGKVTERVKNLFSELTQGKLKKYKEWLTPVY